VSDEQNDELKGICFDCHDGGDKDNKGTYGPYADDKKDSGFSEADKNENLHEEHDKYGCAACHADNPHGSNHRALLETINESHNSYLEINDWASSGEWDEKDCNHDIDGC
jgi:hypothetical protein